jgi:hypothetical protein
VRALTRVASTSSSVVALSHLIEVRTADFGIASNGVIYVPRSRVCRVAPVTSAVSLGDATLAREPRGIAA